MNDLKLNIGSGGVVLDGFRNIDRKNGEEAYPLPDDILMNSVQEINACHILEHFSWNQACVVLRDWFDRMRHDAILKVSVPNFQKIARLQEQGDDKWRFYLMGGQTDSDDFHRSTWTPDMLRNYLLDAGFCDIQEWGGNDLDTSSVSVSLNLQCRKGTEDQNIKAVHQVIHESMPTTKSTKYPDEGTEINIAAVLADPRIGWSHFWSKCSSALIKKGIPIHTYTSCFWHQGMQNLLEKEVDQGVDWVLCLDYDTLFDADQLERMIQLFSVHQGIDALVALQCKRGTQTPLMGIDGGAGRDIPIEEGQELIEVDTAHFGLTLIRTRALKTMDKPWLLNNPDTDGSYTADRVDPDIYFWRKFKEAGNSVYVTPQVRVGHMELLATQYDERMDLNYYYADEYNQKGTKPVLCQIQQ